MEIIGEFGNKSLLARQGILVDLTKKCFTKFEKIFYLFKLKEKSKPLPVIEYILLFKTLYGGCSTCSIQDFEQSAITQLSLVYDKNRKLVIHESKNQDDIVQLAKKLAAELNVRIWDSATNRRHPAWIN